MGERAFAGRCALRDPEMVPVGEVIPPLLALLARRHPDLEIASRVDEPAQVSLLGGAGGSVRLQLPFSFKAGPWLNT